ncbi:MAG: glycerol-3-phosphate dehydrogenase C-terminal domain-containing protein, partial [Terracidiphilus sp.]
GQDTIDRAEQVASFARRPSQTLDLKLHGWSAEASNSESPWESVYGSDLPALRAISDQDRSLEALLHPRLPFRRREVVWAARHEMARTVEDVLARRTRALFLDARAAIEAAPTVARILAAELKRDESWISQDAQRFLEIAKGYLYAD